MNLTVPEQAKRTPGLDSVQASIGDLICAPVAPEVAERFALESVVAL
ncbi:hypothetical protein SAMN04488564_103544 [Lentzea waywayandensis]|uniref:Uncharacterized protein n=1 Tax=Lentzea waywayandensis TaxID=84724 RepID=A0A1I6E0F8_9PSEU|nr:hypothetical protein [Lentzea waywayandensis]SFR11230.1 hypothetical protein SAMN04488564_103544 [Lentzea waywayandensis]